MIHFLLLSYLPAGPLPAEDRFVQPGFAHFDAKQNFRSVGVFGTFGKGDQVQDRDNIGLLSFTLDKGAPGNKLVWANFNGSKDQELGTAVLPGSAAAKHFTFIDWTTAKLEVEGVEEGRATHSEVYFSRAFPAALYKTTGRRWGWKPGFTVDGIAYRDASGMIASLKAGQTVGKLGAPWVVLWGKVAAGKETVPMLLRFEKKPKSLVWNDGLQAEFTGEAGSIVVMPLNGVRRDTPASWAGGLPSSAIPNVEFWTRATASFPIRTDETFKLDDARRKVTISNRYHYLELHDDWGTKPLVLAPVPPITALAEQKGYPVRWLGGKAKRSNVATLLGPYSYVNGDELSYEIPVPSARDNALTPVNVTGDSARDGYRTHLNELALSKEIKPDDTSDGGLGLQLKEYAQSYPLLTDLTRAEVGPKLSAALDASFSPTNLQTITDPVTGQTYVMCGKIWCATEPFDREWYAGRQLDAAAEFGSWIDRKKVLENWKAIQGLYSYYRIYNDWAWSGTLSSVFAYALCGDGMNFAMEGMLGTARMAKWAGDDEMWRDASYRAAKEAVCTFGSWHVSDWLKSVDYVTWTDTSYDYEAKKGRYEIKRMAPADVESRFGLDIFSDYTGIKAFRPGSFWHATAAIYWNNSSLDRLYAETIYDKLYRWEYEIMPQLHPKWTDRDAVEKFGNSPYGSNLVIAHLDARTVLFGEAPRSLEQLTTKLQPDIALLYHLRATSDLVQSGTPQLWLPTAQVAVRESRWNVSTKTLTAILTPLSSGPATLDWTWRQGPSSKATPGPKPGSITVNGRLVPFKLVAGGFYRCSVSLKEGEATRFEVVYP